MDIGGYEFYLVTEISPFRKENGEIIEDYPAERYQNDRNLSLNKHGEGPFCKFRISELHTELGNLSVQGVYVLVSGTGEELYVGETEDLFNRFSNHYGRIFSSSRQVGGQSTNCKVNNFILNEAIARKSVWLYLLETEERKRIEKELIYEICPPWNSKKGSTGGAPAIISRQRKTISESTVGSGRMKQVDKIREYVKENYFDPARAAGEEVVSFVLRDVSKGMKLVSRNQNISRVLQGDKLLRKVRAERLTPNYDKPNSSNQYRYRLLK